MHMMRTPPLMTSEEFLGLPDDGTERWLDKGVVRETDEMKMRNRMRSTVMARIVIVLGIWLGRQPEPRGEILCGEAGFHLRDDPDTDAGVDVAYVSAELLARQTTARTIVVGVPVLAVEILSPSTSQADLHDKVRAYREAGTPLVWVVDPEDRTVRIYQAGAEPVLVNATQALDGGPHLPGFSVPVAQLFP
ncbi:MAG: Uma2 family endonuclease [Gemmataceae bacterium]|nr:Uma2 family endonuclease [Gemmataceae bacterium]